MSDEILERLWEMGPQYVEFTPHAKMLGFKFVAVDIGRVTLSLPYAEHLIGNSDTGVIHGGAITALLDQASGFAALSSFKPLRAVATLDLRIDYMRAATPGKTVIAEARAYKTTKHLAFVRAIAHEGNVDDPVASSQASFMTSGRHSKPQDGPTSASAGVES